MTESIEKSKVLGRLVRVSNLAKRKFSNSKDDYLAVWVQDPDGTNERCLVFTDREIKLGILRAKKHPENIPTK